MRRTHPDSDLNEPPPPGRNRRDPHHAGRQPGGRRRQLLGEDPGIDVVDMATLVRIATAIEKEAVRRYAQLAGLMDRRGEPAVAAAFRVMLEEEQRHVDAVDQWAASLGEPPAAAADYEWRLPADLSSSWEEVAGSALLTPYRAFALAVENEERAFAFYAYLAARAVDAQVRAEAEKLGGEELRHAALLRRWRRRAYHRERRSVQPRPARIESVEELREFLARREGEIAMVHFALVQRLERAGDEAGARLLERSIPGPAQPPAGPAGSGPGAPAADTAGDSHEEPRHLFVEAQRPLETLADELEVVMATAEGELFEAAAAAMSDVIERISGIALQVDGS